MWVGDDSLFSASALAREKTTNGSNAPASEHKIVWEGDLEPLQIV